MEDGSFVQSPPKRRGRPPKAPVTTPASESRDPGADAAMTMLERMDAVPREQALADVEALRARLRAAHAPVHAVILQLRALRDVHLSELNRAATLPFGHYAVELGPNTVVRPLEMKIDEARGILDGRVYRDFAVKSVADQLARLAKQIEQIQIEDVTLIDEILLTCRRAEEWPSVVVRLMSEIRELLARLAEVRQRRGNGVTVRPSGIAVDPPPVTAAGPTAITDFDVFGSPKGA